jgi:hypothetical protein
MRRILLAAISTICLLFSFGLARASGPVGATTAFAEGADLFVNGMVVVHFQKSLGSSSPSERASEAARNLKHLPYWGSIVVRGEGDLRTVSIGVDNVYTVSQDDAADLHTTLSGLATALAAKLQQAMDLPPLRVSDNFVQIGVGHSRVITVIGTMASQATAASADKTVATVTKVGGGFSIKGLTLGSTIVSVSCGIQQENVQVTVEPMAASLPQTLQVMVAGAPATAETVKGACLGAVKTRLQSLPNAIVEFTAPTFSPLEQDKTASYAIPVSATAVNGVATKGIVTVNVENVGEIRKPDDFLWYSNKPENVKQFQSLFSSNLQLGTAVRLLYHHLNGTTEDMYLRVEAVNESKVPAQISIVPGDNTDMDPVAAGIAAGCQFFRNWMTANAEIVTIPPESVMPISFRRLSPGETSSGLCGLRLLSGPNSVLVRTDSLPPLQLDDKWANVIFTSQPWHEVAPHPLNMYDNIPSQINNHIYAHPYQEDTLNYAVGGKYGYARVGEKPIAQVDRTGSLDGNYGVFDTIQVNLTNPTATPAEVELIFVASAGYAGAVFLVNGQFQLIRQIRPEGTAKIGQYHLDAGQSVAVSLVTLPLSGSSYPITIIARAISDY